MCQISVIVPVYRVENSIRRCIESILEQSFDDFELILVDDGSPDNCPSICDEYAKFDTRVKVIHQSNSGVSAARNAGLESSQGRYVTFADSDDYVSKEWLSSLYLKAIQCDADMAMSGIVWVDTDGREVDRTIRRDGIWCLKSEQDRIEYIIHNILYNGNGWEVWTTLFENEIIKKQRIRFGITCHNFAEDLGFILEYVLYCKKIVVIEDCQYYYVQHDSSMMAKSKSVIKLDSLNEVSYQFGHRFFNVIKEKRLQQIFPLIHYLILLNQYTKIDLYSQNRTYIQRTKKEIVNVSWHDRWLRKLMLCRKCTEELMGEETAAYAIVNSRYYANRNLMLFRIEKNIVKWLIERRR